MTYIYIFIYIYILISIHLPIYNIPLIYIFIYIDHTHRYTCVMFHVKKPRWIFHLHPLWAKTKERKAFFDHTV